MSLNANGGKNNIDETDMLRHLVSYTESTMLHIGLFEQHALFSEIIERKMSLFLLKYNLNSLGTLLLNIY